VRHGEVRQVSTASEPRHALGIRIDPTPGRRTPAAVEACARTVVARKGILAGPAPTTIAGIAAEATRSAASFCSYYNSKGASYLQLTLVNVC
jgi:hypothetical protein